jgi:hypothetical protein
MVIDPHAESYSNQSPYNYVMNMPVIATDPNGMDTHLSGQAAQDFFRQLQQGASNNSIDQIDDKAQSTMKQSGGESAANFTIDPQKLKTFDIKDNDGKKIGVVYSYFKELRPDIGDPANPDPGAYGGIEFMFGALITAEGSTIKPEDLDWIQRVMTDRINGNRDDVKPNEWFDDQSPGAIAAGGRYYMTLKEKQKHLATNTFLRDELKVQQYHSAMWDRPTRRVYENGVYANSYWMANLSLVNIHNNNSSLIIFSYGYSITNGNFKATKPTVIDKSK